MCHTYGGYCVHMATLMCHCVLKGSELDKLDKYAPSMGHYLHMATLLGHCVLMGSELDE